MKTEYTLKEFNDYLHRGGLVGAPQTPAAGFALLIGFYNDVRFEEVDLDEDGDALLFQWGTYDWGRGLHFEVDLTRQLIRGRGNDEDVWQLHLTYRFPQSEALQNLGEGNRWCELPADVSAFKTFLMGHPALKAVGAREDGQAEIGYECAG